MQRTTGVSRLGRQNFDRKKKNWNFFFSHVSQHLSGKRTPGLVAPTDPRPFSVVWLPEHLLLAGFQAAAAVDVHERRCACTVRRRRRSDDDDDGRCVGEQHKKGAGRGHTVGCAGDCRQQPLAHVHHLPCGPKQGPGHQAAYVSLKEALEALVFIVLRTSLLCPAREEPRQVLCL